MKNFISILLSGGLALGIVGGGVYLMARSTNGIALRVLKPETPAPGNPAIGRQTTQSDEMAEPPAAQGGIIKCLAHGKTSYGDQPCEHGAKTQQVEIHDTHGVVSPNAATIRAARQRIEAQMPTQAVAASTTAPTKTADPFVCDALSNEINYIDAETRNRLSGEAMQQYRIRREQVRTQQFRAGC